MLLLLLRIGRDSFQDLIPNNIKTMIVYSGLRGAVSFSCAMIFPDTFKGHRLLLLSSTIMVILITVVLQGGFTFSAMQLLSINSKECHHEYDKVKSYAANVLNKYILAGIDVELAHDTRSISSKRGQKK